MWIRNLQEADKARETDRKLLGEISESVSKANALRREIEDIERKLPKLRSMLTDQDTATARLQAERRELQGDLDRVDALLRAEWERRETR